PQNLIAQSQSGTGKTAAFVLAMLSRVNAAEKSPQCLCLAPTYELALQIGRVIETIGRFCADVRVTYAVRGNRAVPGAVPTAQIVIGTPGTMLDWCFKQKVVDVKKIKLKPNMFSAKLNTFLAKLNTSSAEPNTFKLNDAFLAKPNTFIAKPNAFSATLNTFLAKPNTFSTKPNMFKPNDISLAKLNTFIRNLSAFSAKLNLSSVEPNMFSTKRNTFKPNNAFITKRNTRRSADWLALEMSQDGHRVAVLTAELTVAQRADVIQRFRDGKEKVLIATNVCARGIDVQQVTVVVNFSLPTDQKNRPDFETYLHRIGRTGRFGKRGIAFSMVESADVGLVLLIEKHFREFPPKSDVFSTFRLIFRVI
ncbi:DDX25 helicase, partial [Columbina picui]|nr:DDX25 helicase [Columbina picui]